MKLLLTDVDGVLTDGTVIMGGGQEFKRFSIQDGLGLRLFQKTGGKVGWISNRPSDATAQRAVDLKVDFLSQTSGSKIAAAEQIRAQAGVAWEEVCFVGDDVVDLGLLARAGVAVAVADGIEEARAAADYVTQARGGDGAVREVVTLILQAQDRWQPLVEEYAANH